MKNLFLILAGATFFFSSCNQNNRPVDDGNKVPPQTEITLVKTPAFNADSAYSFIAKQVSFGPRIPNTPAQNKCADWMVKKLKSYGCTVYEQNTQVKLYDGKIIPCRNVIGAINPNAAKRILLCSHWDTRPWADQDSANPKTSFDGADDGASGVGVLLEIARQIQQDSSGIGVDLAFFDVEDYGPPYFEKIEEKDDMYCLGTQYWTKNPHVPGYQAYYGILLDMVGAKGATFYLEGTSMNFAPGVMQTCWDVAAKLGYSSMFVKKQIQGIIDDHLYVNRNNHTPTLDLIYMTPTTKTHFAPHWHTHDDNMKIIDKKTLKSVGDVLLQMIFREPV